MMILWHLLKHGHRKSPSNGGLVRRENHRTKGMIFQHAMFDSWGVHWYITLLRVIPTLTPSDIISNIPGIYGHMAYIWINCNNSLTWIKATTFISDPAAFWPMCLGARPALHALQSSRWAWTPGHMTRMRAVPTSWQKEEEEEAEGSWRKRRKRRRRRSCTFVKI